MAVQNTNSYTTTPVGLEAWAQFIYHYLLDIAINVDARATVTNARMYEDSLRLRMILSSGAGASRRGGSLHLTDGAGISKATT